MKKILDENNVLDCIERENNIKLIQYDEKKEALQREESKAKCFSSQCVNNENLKNSFTDVDIFERQI